MKFRATAHKFPAGHRLRLALSSACWPYAWPSPEVVSLIAHLDAGSQLLLPVHVPSSLDATLKPFAEPETSPPLKSTTLREPVQKNDVSFEGDWCTRKVVADQGVKSFEQLGFVYEAVDVNTFRIKADDPLSASVVCDRDRIMQRGEFNSNANTAGTRHRSQG